MVSAGKPAADGSAEKALERFFADISKGTAARQIAVGAASGWLTGFVTVKVGKSIALIVGGSIILLQIANEQGYVNVNWNKITRKADKIIDKVEEQVTGQSSTMMDKAERYVDRQLDRAEDALRQKQRKARKWYTAFVGNEKRVCINEFHLFLGAFIAGCALGIGSA